MEEYIPEYLINRITLIINKKIEDAEKNTITEEQEINRKDQSNVYNIYRSIKIPGLTISKYLVRLVSFCDCSSNCYVVTLIYIDKIIKKHSEIVFDSFTSHRLLLSCLIIAIKYLDDDHYENKRYADIFGLRLLELNNLERLTLQILEYNMFVSYDEFNKYSCYIYYKKE
jgi:hypothetical protein